MSFSVRNVSAAELAWMEGFFLCEGCGDEFVRSGYCEKCEAVHRDLALAWTDSFFSRVDRLGVGVAPWNGPLGEIESRRFPEMGVANRLVGAAFTAVGMVAFVALNFVVWWLVPHLVARLGLWASQ